MLEAYNNVSFQKFSYIVLNNNLQSDMDYRIYSQIFKDEQLLVFKKLRSNVWRHVEDFFLRRRKFTRLEEN